MDEATVIVPTFGARDWVELAQTAIRSAESQAPVIHRHGTTLQQARNEALALVETPWVIHLDADDELEPGYVAAMQKGTADVRAPRVRCYRHGRPVRRGLFMPQIGAHMVNRAHQCSGECLPFGNWIVVGAMARTELLREVGGWEDWPIYEDWALWLRCWKAGGTVEPIPAAVYRQHLRPDSRNHTGDAFVEREQWHERIVTAVLGEVPTAA